MAPPSGGILTVSFDDKTDHSLGSEAFHLPLLSSPSRSFSDGGAPVVVSTTRPPEPDNKPWKHWSTGALEARIVDELPAHALSSGWNDEPSCKPHDHATSKPKPKPKSKFAFGGGNAVAPEPPKNFNEQERERREKNLTGSVRARKNSLTIAGGSNFGVLSIYSMKASRLFLSHCWRNIAMKPRKEEMFSHLTESGCIFWADFLDLQEEGAVEWRKEIEGAIQGCSKFVSFIDYQYLLSFNCLEEMMFALHNQKPIVLSILDQDAWDLLTCSGAAQKAWNAQPSSGCQPLSSFEGKSTGPGGAPFSLQMVEEIFEAIGNINFCPCRDLDIQLQGKDEIYERLFRFVEKDLDYAKEYADLKHRTEVWEAAEMPARLLIPGKDSIPWHQWLTFADKIVAQPPPSPAMREFIRASVKRRQQQTKLKLGALTGVVVLILLGAVAAVVMAFKAEHERGVAEQQRFLAEQQKTLADKQRIIAEQQRSVAEEQRSMAEEQRDIAEERKAEAELQGAVASTLLLSADRKPYSTAGIRAQNFAAYRAKSFGIPEVVLPALHDTLKHLLDNRYQFLDFEGHRAQINSVDFSPSGSSLLSSSKDGTIIIWPISWNATGMVPDLVEPVVLTGDWGSDHCVFAQWMDEDTFAAAFEDGDFQVWRKHAVDGWKAELSASPHRRKILAMAVSRDGLKVATGDKKTIAVWSFDEESSSLSEHSATVFGSNKKATALVFSPDGRYLIFQNDKGVLSYADTEGDLEETIAVLAELPATVPVTALAFSPDDGWLIWLAVGSEDGVTHLIDWNETSVNASKVVHSITSPMPTMSSLQVVAGMAWSSESMLIVAADVGTVSFWEIPDNEDPSDEPVLLHQMVYKTTAESAPIHATGVAFSDKIGGGSIALSSEESMLRLWHPTPQLGLEGPQGFQMQMTPDYPSKITAISWSKTRMAACPSEGGINIWELNPVTGDWSQAAIGPVFDDAIEGKTHCRSLGWAPDESMVAVGLNENIIEVWKRQDDGTWARVMHGATSGAVRRSPSFTPNNRWLAVPSKGSPEIYLFLVPSHASPGNHSEDPVQPDLILSHDDGEIKSVAWAPFSPSGAGDLVLASSGEDNTRLWDLSDTGSEESAGLTIEGSTTLADLGFPYATSMDWSVDGRLFALSHEGFGRVWHWQRDGSSNSSGNNAGAWASLLQVEGHTGIRSSSISWSPDGSQLVIPFDDNSLRIYNVNGQAGLAEVLYQIEHKCEWLHWMPVSLGTDLEASRIACANTVGAVAAEGETFDFTFNMLVVDFAEQYQLLQRMTYGHLTARDLQIMRLERLQDQLMSEPEDEST